MCTLASGSLAVYAIRQLLIFDFFCTMSQYQLRASGRLHDRTALLVVIKRSCRVEHARNRTETKIFMANSRRNTRLDSLMRFPRKQLKRARARQAGMSVTCAGWAPAKRANVHIVGGADGENKGGYIHRYVRGVSTQITALNVAVTNLAGG